MSHSTSEYLLSEHCENCGSREFEDLYLGDQGYTACCNEPVCHYDNCTREADGTGHIQGSHHYEPLLNYEHPYTI